MIGFEDEFELWFLRGGLLIELGAQAVGTLALALGGALGGGAQQFLHVVSGLGLEVARVLIGRGQEAGEGGFQRDGGAGCQHGEGFGDRHCRSARAGATRGGQSRQV